MRIRPIPVLACTLLLVACVAGCGSASPAGPARAAVSGRVFSAGCPAQWAGQRCGSWFAGVLRFVRVACTPSGGCSVGRLAASTRSDRHGRFRVALEPGRYAIVASGLENSLNGQMFTVGHTAVTGVRFSIRNGIE